MKKIYICHQYMTQSHFKALYDCVHLYGYKIEDYIILNPQNIHKDFECEWRNRKYFKAIKGFVDAERKLVQLRFLRNEIIIVGVAPYDDLMLCYSSVFRKNRSIYFTSWQYWDGKKYPKGKLENKARFEKILSHNFKAIACVTKRCEEEVAKFGLPTKIVNHAIESDQYKVKSDYARSGKYIFLGELSKRKNIGVILNYMRNHRDVPITVDFVGEGALEKEVVRAIKSDGRIRYLGKWDKEKIEQNLCEYDFLILPSHEEPFGIVLIEAITCGVPCIVSNALGPQEIIVNGKTGFVFNLEDENGFDKIMRLSIEMDDERYCEMCRNAIKDSAQYSCKKIVKRWVELIRKVES